MDKTGKILETALLAGTILVESNAESYRTEETVEYFLKTADSRNFSALALSTGIYATVYNKTEERYETSFVRVNTRTNNLRNISGVNDISYAYAAGDIDIEEAYQQLAELKIKNTEYPAWMNYMAVALMGPFYSFLFSGGMEESLIALLAGLGLVLAQMFHKKIGLSDGFSIMLETMVITLIANLGHAFIFPDLSTSIVIFATLMPLFPGTAITNALRDIFKQDFLSGLARSASAFYEAVMIALGTVLANAILGGIGL